MFAFVYGELVPHSNAISLKKKKISFSPYCPFSTHVPLKHGYHGYAFTIRLLRKGGNEQA